MSALKKIYTVGNDRNPKSLLNAFKEIKSKTPKRLRNRSCGIDNITIDKFERRKNIFLREIANSIKEDKSYQFSSLKAVIIPKNDGKDRLICIPTLSDRIVQKSVLNYLSAHNKYAQFNGVSYGFVKNKSTKDALNNAIRTRNIKQYAYKTDISSFFDSILRKKLESIVLQKINEKSLHKILINAINCELEKLTGSMWRRVKKTGIIIGKGIRQGMPLSPFFANLFLYEFDREVLNKNYQMIRYADDLIFFAEDFKKCLDIHNFCKNELLKIGLQIHDLNISNSKTKIYKPDETVDFLGLGIERHNNKYRAIITKKQREKIKDNIFKYSDIDYLHRHNITMGVFSRIMESVINGYLEAYKICDDEMLHSFYISLKQWVNSTKRKLFQNGLGIDLKKLNSIQLDFLGIDIN